LLVTLSPSPGQLGSYFHSNMVFTIVEIVLS
jgi:hypothetical protein